MSRQSDKKKEERETRRRDALVRALDHGIVDALDLQGIHLLGLSIRHDAYSCLLTIRADIGGVRSVAFVGADSIINCYLKAHTDANSDSLTWTTDKYYAS